jgi:hypothetical protein
MRWADRRAALRVSAAADVAARLPAEVEALVASCAGPFLAGVRGGSRSRSRPVTRWRAKIHAPKPEKPSSMS